MSEKLKQNHHYVPQFWLRRFAGADGHLNSWDGKRSAQVGSRSVMAQDWLYTVYGAGWVANNDLEDYLSILEGKAGKAFETIEQSADLTQQTADPLLDFIALQACRHPDILQRKLRRTKELGEFFALAHVMAPQEFEERAEKFGISQTDAANILQELTRHSADELISQYNIVEHLGLQDREIPLAEFLDAVTPIANALSHMNIRLLDAPKDHFFVLGDTPVPQEDAVRGFIVPLNKSLAVEFGSVSSAPAIYPRMPLTQLQVAAINRTQWEMAQKLVVGPNKETFNPLSV